jgi:transcriptional regulator with XRE-family HTH domain
MSRNQRLYDAFRQVGKRYRDIADELGADPKTVERWVTEGRLPRPAIRQSVAQLVGVPEAVLWPDAPGVAYGTSELVGIYTTRRELPPATVAALLDSAERHIDVLAYAALWLWDTVPRFAEQLELKVAQNASVRLCLGDPNSDAVLLRGQEEGVGGSLAARCRLALGYAQPIHHVDPHAVRISGATLYATILRFDNDVLLNTHLSGNPASESPVFHFHHEQAHGIAASAIGSFERVWEAAQLLPDG